MTKQHILDEIKRTAEVNGGVPLGRLRFLAETGIRENDWLGRFWARWNDALAEAGYPPNTFNKAYTDDELLGPLSDFVRQLGHFPVRGELRMKARQGPEFPTDKTFNRFGNKANLVARLREFAVERGDVDVADVCDAALASVAKSDNTEPEVDDVEFGFVYLLKAGRFYKIGKTNAVGRRERELAIQLPERAAVVHSIRTDDPSGIEDYWHRRFSERRKNGEWFELTTADVSAFRRRKFM